MIEPSDILSISFKLCEMTPNYLHGFEKEKYDFYDLELMQSTGLKDKNGKEIFEGDILAIETDEGILNVNIFWDSKHALFMFESKKYNEEDLLAELVEDNTYPFEIAGNIYENPELLEVTE
ncbi:YopX family protein [Streptococcus parasanguinis]|uniref:YopX family protein n=1 Tax=Streptococcus parasanguinis TaxID=1318 RepID=UPI0039C1DA01